MTRHYNDFYSGKFLTFVLIRFGVHGVIVAAVDGLMNVSSSTHWQWNDVSLVTSDEWMTGGEWQPTGCMARYHMAVIIPFRDRDAQLKALLRHLIPMLRRQFLHFRIFVVEQVTRTVNSKYDSLVASSAKRSTLLKAKGLVYETQESLAKN